MKYFAGIGSRKIIDYPQAEIERFELAILECMNHNYSLRSGGALGCDRISENISKLFDNHKYAEIYRTDSDKIKKSDWIYPSAKSFNEAHYYIEENNLHPYINTMKDYSRLLHCRNVFQILGADLNTLSKFVVCWTPDGAESFKQCTKDTGGTGTAIKIASINDIPVFNIRNENRLNELLDYLELNK